LIDACKKKCKAHQRKHELLVYEQTLWQEQNSGTGRPRLRNQYQLHR